MQTYWLHPSVKQLALNLVSIRGKAASSYLLTHSGNRVFLAKGMVRRGRKQEQSFPARGQRIRNSFHSFKKTNGIGVNYEGIGKREAEG